MIKRIIFLIFFLSSVYAQNLKISGLVFNEESKEPVPYASIRIAGTTQGTSTNIEGKFLIYLSHPNSKLIITAVGYRKKDAGITDSDMADLKIALRPEPIQFMEIVVGTDEDPAYRIVREAIRRKVENRAGLQTLEYSLFSKDIFLSSGEVAMVSERISTGYYQKEKREKIITHSVHISENEKKNALKFDQNIVDKMYIDFTEDTLAIIGNKVFLPLATNAFDWYDYKLLEVKQAGSVHECYIEVIPKSGIQPLLAGKMVIEDSTYSLKSIHFWNNDGLRFPYVNDLKIEFIQNRDRFNNYWLPTYLKVESGLKLSFGGLIGTDAISMNQVSMFTNYKINKTIPDSIYKTFSTLDGDSAKSTGVVYVKAGMLNRAQIDSLRPIPLTGGELKAYRDLDSTKSVVSQIKFTGLLGGLAQDAVKKEENKGWGNQLLSYAGKVFSVLSFRDNRVDGIMLGVHNDGYIIKDKLNYKTKFGYAFGRKEFEWKLVSVFRFKNLFIENAEIELSDEAVQWQALNPYPDLLNGINVLLGFEDQFNYYRSKTFRFGLNNKFANGSFTVNYLLEIEKSLPALKYQSAFNTGRFVRINPPVTEGTESKVSLNLLLGKSPQNYQPVPQDGLIAQFDFSNPSIGSDFNYKRIRVISQFSVKTLYKELFSSPYLLLGLEGGALTGSFGHQHILTPNSALNVYSPFQSFKGLSPYEYSGDKMLAAHAEHNWRSVPFQSLGLNFFTDLNIDFITGMSVLKMWNESSYFRNQTADKIYWEVYAGIGKIFGVGRVDFSYGSNNNFVVRVGLSAVL